MMFIHVYKNIFELYEAKGKNLGFRGSWDSLNSYKKKFDYPNCNVNTK